MVMSLELMEKKARLSLLQNPPPSQAYIDALTQRGSFFVVFTGQN